MAIVVKNELVCEDIVNENGEIIGQIKFNPNDSNIMKTLTEIIYDLNNALKKLNEFEDLNFEKLNKNSSVEDFMKLSKEFEDAKEIFEIEYNVIKKSITELIDIFGEDCIHCFTKGTMDINALVPLIEFITPYVKNSRTEKVNKYISKNDDVME